MSDDGVMESVSTETVKDNEIMSVLGGWGLEVTGIILEIGEKLMKTVRSRCDGRS